jgi:hypothetical protein
VCCLDCLGDIRATASKWAHIAGDATLPSHKREAAAKKSIALCPACTQPIGDKVAETGEAVGAAPTFVMQAPSTAAARQVAPTAGKGFPSSVSVSPAGRGRRGGRGGRGGGAARDGR